MRNDLRLRIPTQPEVIFYIYYSGNEIELFGKIDGLAVFGDLIQKMLFSGQGWTEGTVDEQDNDGL